MPQSMPRQTSCEQMFVSPKTAHAAQAAAATAQEAPGLRARPEAGMDVGTAGRDARRAQPGPRAWIESSTVLVEAMPNLGAASPVHRAEPLPVGGHMQAARMPAFWQELRACAEVGLFLNASELLAVAPASSCLRQERARSATR